jgi:hypothetical protein
MGAENAGFHLPLEKSDVKLAKIPIEIIRLSS